MLIRTRFLASIDLVYSLLSSLSVHELPLELDLLDRALRRPIVVQRVMSSTCLPKHILWDQVVLVVSLRHHGLHVVWIVVASQGVVVLRVTGGDTTDVESVLVGLTLVVMTFVELNTIEHPLLLLFCETGSVDTSMNVLSAFGLRVLQPLLSLIFVLVDANVYSGGVLGAWMLVERVQIAATCSFDVAL